ncbi:guanyl-specific ribonuclease C2 [Mycena leptocephala]|nr:guanyl-specific ribonuclease C2 [Mycena leptocephala]
MFPARALLTAIILAPLALATPALGPKGDVTCGSNKYRPAQVKSAVNKGYSLVRAGSSLGGYPHVLTNSEKFPLLAECSTSRVYDFPLLPGGLYTGLTAPGPDRVVFTGQGTYCGVLTHTGARGDDLVGCSGAP